MAPVSPYRVLQRLEMTEGGMMEEQGATCLKDYESSYAGVIFALRL